MAEKLSREQALADSRLEGGKRIHNPCGKVIWKNDFHTCGRHLGRPRKAAAPPPAQAKQKVELTVMDKGAVVEEKSVEITVDPSLAVDVDAEMRKVMSTDEYEKADREEGEKQLIVDARRTAKRKRVQLLADVLPQGGQLVWHHVHKFEEHLVNWIAGTRNTNDALNFVDSKEGETLDKMANAAFPLDLDIKLAYVLTNLAIFGGYLVVHLDNLAGRFSGWMAKREQNKLARAETRKKLKALEQQSEAK